ncbi:hypothetical protein EYR38_005101 [Pleurotus pulmonarius]|nr:hypothetical protein EYR38_005101 [Pleurotus pulmonarius]
MEIPAPVVVVEAIRVPALSLGSMATQGLGEGEGAILTLALLLASMEILAPGEGAEVIRAVALSLASMGTRVPEAEGGAIPTPASSLANTATRALEDADVAARAPASLLASTVIRVREAEEGVILVLAWSLVSMEIQVPGAGAGVTPVLASLLASMGTLDLEGVGVAARALVSSPASMLVSTGIPVPEAEAGVTPALALLLASMETPVLVDAGAATLVRGLLMSTNNVQSQGGAVPFPGAEDSNPRGATSAFSVTPTARLSPANNNTPQSVTPQGSPRLGGSRVLATESRSSSPKALTNSSSKESKLTSSDKLSALPASPPTRHRAFRRSLDAPASSSLPAITNNELFKDASFTSLPANSTLPRQSSAEGGTPKQRISSESDRISLPTFHNVRQAFSRSGRASDPAGSPALHPNDLRSQKDLPSSRSASHSRSRAASPLRFLQNWAAGRRGFHTREEPFIPVDPFQAKFKFGIPDLCPSWCFFRDHPTDEEVGLDAEHRHFERLDYACEDTLPTCLPSRSSIEAAFRSASNFLTETLPRILYLYLLLRLPALYFSRVARIFRDAEVSKPDINRMCEGGLLGSGFVPHIDLAASGGVAADLGRRGVGDPPPSGALAAGVGYTAHISAAAAAVPVPLPYPEEWSPPLVSPALVRFKNSWEVFIDSLLREWKTLNLVSALLLSAIMTMFQVPDAAYDPITRTAALISMICALMSLTYGCIYIVRFGTMRSMYRASRWAEEARKTYTVIWWNAWILLAMPAVWLAWSLISFIVCILSFVWRTGSTLDPHERDPMTPRQILGPRIAITAILVLGLIYFALIINTLKSYGTQKRRGEVAASAASAAVAGERVEGDTNNSHTNFGERRGRERQRSQRRHRRQEGHHSNMMRERGGPDASPSGNVSPPARETRSPNVGSNVLGLGLIDVDEVKGGVDDDPVKEAIRLAQSISSKPLNLTEASSTLLPPKPLFRRLLRAHRVLPTEMRSLGDVYVKAEFRRHKEVTNPVHIMGFLSQWKVYLDQLPRGSDGRDFAGKKLDPTLVEKMSAEQLGQLYEFMHATKDVWKPASDA